jgi:elongation factor G
MVDLVTGEHITFSGDSNEIVNRNPVPAELEEAYRFHREAMIERLADESDEIALLYLDGTPVDTDLLKREIRRLTLARRIVPVFAGSGKLSLGIQPLADAAVDYLPSPLDIGSIQAHSVKSDELVTLNPDPDEPFAGLIFKVTASTTSDLFYIRTYSGTIRANGTLMNSRTREKIRAKQLFKIYAKSTEMVDEAGPGDIVGLVGIKDCGIGDTLCEPRRLVSFERITFPEPVISMAVEPKYSRDKEKLDEMLGLLCREDQTLTKTVDEETGQRLLSGMGELHLEINIKRLQADFNVEARVGEPRVAYREALKAATTEHVEFSKVIGETELYASVDVAFQPLDRGGDMFRVENSMRDRERLPRAFVHAAEQALEDGMRTGGNHGYPLIYLAADLKALKISPDKTTEGAVVGAVLASIDQAINHVGTVMLEPIMRLEVLAPEETVGEITMYLHPRRAVIHDMLQVGEFKRILCEVPLAEMFGFGKALPRLTGGRGTFTMEPFGYQEIPADVAKQMMAY